MRVDRGFPSMIHKMLAASNHLSSAAAFTATLEIDIENSLQTLGLRLIEARRSAGVWTSCSSGALGSSLLPRLAGATGARYFRERGDHARSEDSNAKSDRNSAPQTRDKSQP